MKTATSICYLSIFSLALIAQTVIQPSSGSADKPETVNTWDTLAIIVGGITFAGFLVYLIWLYGKKKIIPRVQK